VALTRAKDFLEVLVPLKYYFKKGRASDRHSFAQLTRFLPEGVFGHFERVKLEPKPDVMMGPPPPLGARADVKAKIASMWG
jgi:DNA helicase-2/ATP-dependent DNA helicase PcrA